MTPEFKVQGSGPPFLYVAGVEGTGRLFYKQAEDLARDHTVITFPLRGVGRYEMGRLVEDVRAVVRAAGFERVTVLGESFGGLLTMAAAVEHPELFERIILVNTFPFFAQRAKIRFGVAVFSLLPLVLLKFHRTGSARRVLFSEDVAEDDRRLFRELTRELAYEGYLSRMRIIRDTDLRPRLHEIRAPVLVVAGTDDRLLDSVKNGRLLAERLPRARLKLLEGTGHTALLSGRVRVRDWLAEFEEF